MKAALARVHNGLAWLAVVGSVVQFFMIALSVFGGASLEMHAWSGRVLEGIAGLMLIVAVIIRTSRRTTWYSVAVFLLLFPVQGMLAFMDLPPEVKALHAVTGTAILFLSHSLAAGKAKAVAMREPVLNPVSAD